MKRSTGLRNYMLGTGSIKSALDGKVIKLYGGTVPASADDALPGDALLLATISVNDTGTGLTFGSAANGQISKSTSEVWSGSVVANGTARYVRMVTAADDNSQSTSAVRIQGTIGLDGADMNFGSIDLVSGNLRQINFLVISVSAG
jgi:hypothetical protein